MPVSAPAASTPTPAEMVDPTATAATKPEATPAPTAAQLAEAEPTATPIETSAPEPEPTPEPLSEPAPAPAIEPIEVTYFTPSQAEGPYYPVSKPEDRDNDLIELAGASAQPAGTVLALSGKLYDAAGMPLQGMVIEIWQTDDNGIYDHPGDPSTDARDRNFQFYGEAITAEDGSFGFRTLLPGRYEPRPRHIHYKIRANGADVMTSQMYFPDDPTLEDDGIFARAVGSEALIAQISEAEDGAGNPIFIGVRDIVLSSEFPAFYADAIQ